MTDQEIVAALSDVDAVGLTLFGEARGERIEGRIAVANVIRNRVTLARPSFGIGFKGVCLKAWAFSCWLPQGGAENYHSVLDAARTRLRNEPISTRLRECLWIADGAVRGQFGDTTRHATHYLTTDLLHRDPPSWAKGLEPVQIIGSHAFFAGVK